MQRMRGLYSVSIAALIVARSAARELAITILNYSAWGPFIEYKGLNEKAPQSIVQLAPE